MQSIHPTRFGKYSIAVLFLISAPFAHADMGDPVTWNTYLQQSNNFVWGNATGQDAFGFDIVSGTTSPIYIDELKIWVYRTGSPTDNLYGWLGYCSAGAGATVRIATSTNYVSGNTLTTGTGGTELTFNFDDVLLEPRFTNSLVSGDYHLQQYKCAGVMREGAYSASNYYRTVISSVSTATTTTATKGYRVGSIRANGTDVGTRGGGTNIPKAVVTGLTYIPETVGGEGCPEGYECYTLEEMASTTEAIYTVGQVTQIYIGLFIVLMFGMLAFHFTKKFI